MQRVYNTCAEPLRLLRPLRPLQLHQIRATEATTRRAQSQTPTHGAAKHLQEIACNAFGTRKPVAANLSRCSQRLKKVTLIKKHHLVRLCRLLLQCLPAEHRWGWFWSNLSRSVSSCNCFKLLITTIYNLPLSLLSWVVYGMRQTLTVTSITKSRPARGRNT